MPEVFDIAKEADTFFGVLVIQAASELPKEKFEEILAAVGEDKTYSVCLTINGIELSAHDAIKWLEDAFEHQVNQRAEELIRDRVQGKLEEVSNSLDRLQEEMVQLVTKGQPPST